MYYNLLCSLKYTLEHTIQNYAVSASNGLMVYVDFSGHIFLLASANKRVTMQPVLLLDFYSKKQYFHPDYKCHLLLKVFVRAVFL